MRYAIWNKQDPIITPIGEVLTPEQWIQRYPVAGLPSITVVCAAGEINGAFFGTLGQMKHNYEEMGVDFSQCETDMDVLEVIDAYEKSANSADAKSLELRQTEALETLAANQGGSENQAVINALLGEDE